MAIKEMLRTPLYSPKYKFSISFAKIGPPQLSSVEFTYVMDFSRATFPTIIAFLARSAATVFQIRNETFSETPGHKSINYGIEAAKKIHES